MDWKTAKIWSDAKRLAIRRWIAARDEDGRIVAVLWEAAAYLAVAAFVLGLILGAEKFRDIALAMAAILGFPLLFQRTRAASLQAETDSRRRMAQAYSQAAELFSRTELSMRLAGLYALWKIAEEDPENHHVQIMRILCAFVRNPPLLDGWKSGDNKLPARDRLDLVAVLELIGKRNEQQIARERKMNYILNLQGADLRGAELSEANLESIILIEAKLESAFLYGANLQEAVLSEANLKGADLSNANLTDASCHQRTNFEGAILNHAILRGANLFDGDFRRARFVSADLRKATLLNAIFDSETNFKNAALNGAEFPGGKGIDAIKTGVVLNDENGVVRPIGFDHSIKVGGDPEHTEIISNLEILEVAEWEKRKQLRSDV